MAGEHSGMGAPSEDAYDETDEIGDGDESAEIE
jgi:hypothetical protein